jgi:hypothetical protein
VIIVISKMTEGENAVEHKHIALILVGYFTAAIAFGLMEHSLEPFPVWNSITISRAVGTALGLFILSGLLPLIGWAIGRFRTRKATPVLIAWAVFGLLFGALMFTENQRSVETKWSEQATRLASGKARDDIVNGCVDTQRSAPINQQFDVTEAQIKDYCGCVADGMSNQLSSNEFKGFIQTGKPTNGVNDKIIHI